MQQEHATKDVEKVDNPSICSVYRHKDYKKSNTQVNRKSFYKYKNKNNIKFRKAKKKGLFYTI